MFFVFAQSVSLNLASSAFNFNCPIFSDGSKPSSYNLVFKLDHYFLILFVCAKAPTITTTENTYSESVQKRKDKN